MSKDPAIFTRTMAKVFTQQGHYDKAEDIYRYLLTEMPDHPDLLKELEAVEKLSGERTMDYVKELSQLVSEWIELMQKYRLIRKLNHLWRKKNGNHS